MPRYIVKSEEDNRTKDILRFFLELQGRLNIYLRGTFTIVIKNAYRY